MHSLFQKSMFAMDSNTSVDNNSENVPPCPIPECNLPIDVIIISSDGAHFGGHRHNLASFAGGLGCFLSDPSEFTSLEKVNFKEGGETLRLLLQYMHHTYQPDLSGVSADVLCELSEAAERYIVYSALPICKAFMEQQTEKKPLSLFIYAIRHGHIDVADKAVFALISHCSVQDFLDEALEAQLPREVIIRWIRYHNMYKTASHTGLFKFLEFQEKDHAYHFTTCPDWDKLQSYVLREFGRDFMLMLKAPLVFQHSPELECETCTNLKDAWEEYMFSRPRVMGLESLKFSDVREDGPDIGIY